METCHSPDSEPRIHIRVVVPKRCVRVISVMGSQCVGSLHQLFSGEQHEFLFKGVVLNTMQSFTSYGIVHNDSLVALPSSDVPESRQAWLGVTRDRDRFSQSVNIRMNPGAMGELARLMDVNNMRRSGSRPWPRPISGLNMRQSLDRRTHGGETNVPQQPSSFSSEELPECW